MCMAVWDLGYLEEKYEYLLLTFERYNFVDITDLCDAIFR